MKIAVCALVFLTTTLTVRASDIADLAAGYAAAFKCLERSTASISYTAADQTSVLKDVKEIRPFGGVLLIRFTNGDQAVLNAAGVSRITPQ